MTALVRSRFALRAGLAAAAVALACLLPFTGGSSRTIQAEFADARGLLVGNSVRINGATIGSVSGISLTPQGTALVALSLNANTPLPRVDAAATIRPVDLLGDIYVSYSPGIARQFLHGPIPLGRTENVPRLADLLQSFTPGARAGAQALIVNLGLGLERRGFDLNRAAVSLRGALEASDQVVAEMASQNAGLESLITSSENLTGQLAQRNPQLDTSVTTFARTLDATAAHATSLNRGLHRLAPTVAALSTTTGQLTGTAHALEPLATQIGAVASPLAETFTRLPSFLAQTRTAITATRPMLRSAATFLQRGSTTFPALSAGLTAAQNGAASTNSLLTTLVQLTPLISKSLFDHVASQTSEPGNEPFDEEDPLRNYWRGAAVLSCQSFGLPITPGCLQTYLAASARTHAPARRSSSGSGRTAPRTTPTNPPASAGTPGAHVGSTAAPHSPGAPTQALGSTLSGVLGGVLGGGASGAGSSGSASGLGSLLNYLLGR
ncbi:MAG: MlaD family protein [Solirubrobacteraceae bacterium]